MSTLYQVIYKLSIMKSISKLMEEVGFMNGINWGIKINRIIGHRVNRLAV